MYVWMGGYFEFSILCSKCRVNHQPQPALRQSLLAIRQQVVMPDIKVLTVLAWAEPYERA